MLHKKQMRSRNIKNCSGCYITQVFRRYVAEIIPLLFCKKRTNKFPVVTEGKVAYFCILLFIVYSHSKAKSQYLNLVVHSEALIFLRWNIKIIQPCRKTKKYLSTISHEDMTGQWGGNV